MTHILNTTTATQPIQDARCETTEVLPQLFGGFDPSRQIRILDLGSAEPESIAFYHRYFARVCIANAVDEWVSGVSPNLHEALPEAARGLVFDICLLWDSLNHLHRNSMREFAREITGYLHTGSRIHAIAAYSPSWAFDAFRYGIVDHNSLALKPRSRPVPHPHSQTEIEKALPGFRIRRTALKRGNRLELMLVHRQDRLP